jgi:hypothetical protein
MLWSSVGDVDAARRVTGRKAAGRLLPPVAGTVGPDGGEADIARLGSKTSSAAHEYLASVGIDANTQLNSSQPSVNRIAGLCWPNAAWEALSA